MPATVTEKKEKRFGTAQERRYDLPLAKGAGSGFLMLLIGLMTFLAVLALAASFALNGMTKRWSSGLENRMTVEIPAQDGNDKILGRDQVNGFTNRIAIMLEQHPAVASVHVLSDQEISDLIRPWLGDDILTLKDAPLPGLISLEVKNGDEKTVNILTEAIKSVTPNARLDTHQNWLSDVLRFTGALKFSATVLILIIGATTATAVAGAVRARMAVHREEVEILHLMGASDQYISRQFQRHSFILAFKGSMAGLFAGTLALMIIGWLTGEMGIGLLPDFHLSGLQIFFIILLPVLASLISLISSDRTVRAVLHELP